MNIYVVTVAYDPDEYMDGKWMGFIEEVAGVSATLEDAKSLAQSAVNGTIVWCKPFLPGDWSSCNKELMDGTQYGDALTHKGNGYPVAYITIEAHILEELSRSFDPNYDHDAWIQANKMA